MDSAPTLDAGSTRAEGTWLRRHAVKLLLSLALGALTVWFLSNAGLPVIPPAGSFANLAPWAVPGYVASLALVHYFRAIRWRHLLNPVGGASARTVVAVSWLGFAAILFAPLRSGEFVRPYLITKRAPVRLWEATGTVGAERVIDGLVLSLSLFAGLQLSTPLSPLPEYVGVGRLRVPVASVPAGAYVALGIFASAFAAMAVFFFARDFARRATHAVVGLVSHRLADLLAGIVERVAAGLRFLPSPRHLVPFVAETLLYWALNAGGIWLLGIGCGLHGMTFGIGVVTMGVVGIGILVPSAPGFFGTFQLATYMALAMYFPPETLLGPGVAFAFLLYTCQVLFHGVAAIAGYALDRRGAEARG